MNTTIIAEPAMDAAEIEEERRRQVTRNQEAIALLRSWADVGDEQIAEQQETLAFLMQALNEDRLSDRDRF
jgi:hypothetical protein